MNQSHLLKWCFLSGITYCIGEKPINRFETAKTKPTIVLKSEEKTDFKQVDMPFLMQALSLSATASDLESLNKIVDNFEGCSLKKTARHTLCGFGQTKNPTVMCLIDAPKSADEKEGRLAQGDMGILLMKMLKAIGLDESNTYLAPLIPWRLPGDRSPTDSETQICLPFLKKRIELLSPDFLLIFGTVPVRGLLNIDSIAKARQQELTYSASKNIPCVATFGPDMVMKGQSYRKSAWTDLQKLAQLIQNKQ